MTQTECVQTSSWHIQKHSRASLRLQHFIKEGEPSSCPLGGANVYWFSVFPASQQTPPRVNPFRPQSACLYLKCTFTFLGQKKTLAAWRTVSLTQRGWRRLSFHSVSAEEGARAPCHLRAFTQHRKHFLSVGWDWPRRRANFLRRKFRAKH